MLGKTHLMVGALAGAALAANLQADIPTSIGMWAAGGLGALLADIDTPGSMISRRARPARLLVFWLKHRGVTHSLLILCFVGLLAYRLAAEFGIALALGHASHLLADMMTKDGVPLLWPYPRRLHVLPPFFRLTTGGLIEQLVSLAATIGLLWFLVHWYA